MPRKTWVGGWALVLCTCMLAGNGCQGKQKQKRAITLKLFLPQESVTILIDGTVVPGSGGERTVTRDMPEGKDYVDVTAVFQPNPYTKISRPRKVMWKESRVVVDFLDSSVTEKDHIEVRFVATPQELVAEMCKLAKVNKEDVVYDLGCGDGRMVITAVKDFGAKRGVGIEIDPGLVAKSNESAKSAGVADRVEFRLGDVLKVDDLSDASVVLLYMGEDINLRLKPILQKTLNPGSRVVSHRFLMGDDWPADRTETRRIDKLDYNIHLWVIKDSKN